MGIVLKVLVLLVQAILCIVGFCFFGIFVVLGHVAASIFIALGMVIVLSALSFLYSFIDEKFG